MAVAQQLPVNLAGDDARNYLRRKHEQAKKSNRTALITVDTENRVGLNSCLPAGR